MKVAKTKLMLSGLNLKYAVEALAKSGYTIFDLKILDPKNITFCVKCKDCQKVVAYLKKKCYNVSIIGKVGVALLLDNIKKHCVALVLILLCLCFCAVLGNTCLDVVVSAEESVFQEVSAAVENYGIKKGIRLSDVSLDGLENSICVAVTEVKYAFVQIKGCRLFVNVVLRDIADLPIDMDTPVDIVATCDGVITNLLVLNGTAVVKVGDKVVKGQVLISGQTTYLDGSQTPTRAMGEVYAVCESRAEILFCPTTTQFVPTGSVTKRRCIKIGKYTSAFNKEIEYDFFETEYKSTRLFPLGIEVYFETVYETKQETRQISLEDAKPSLQAQAYMQALKNAVFDLPQQTEYGVVERADKTYVYAALYAETKISAVGG